MKRNNIQNIFGWMPASLLLLFATACSESIIDTANVNSNVPNVVTFTVNTESNTVSTRAGEETTYHISDGSHADVLIYAVYSVKTSSDGKTETLTLEEEFGKEGVTIDNVTTGTGQVILSPTSYPHKIKLSLDPSKEYRVAFWAQNSKTSAYDTQDLKNVKVNYSNAANNDELRDAFCALSNKITYLTEKETVTLRRPLAQVNVGTTGWDYEGAAILKPSSVSYTQSQITLKGVAQYYDVTAGKAIVDDTEHTTTDVTFDYARIPAFINVSDDDFKNNLTYSPFENEEYLKVKLYEGQDYKPYVSWKDYQDYKAELAEKKDTPENLPKLPETEMFKYLSMCYVLVPEAESLKKDDETSKYPGSENATFGSVLSEVEFSTQGIDKDVETEAETSGIGKVFSLNNVPVQKNWRTNILGNNFFFLDQPLTLTIVTDYNGEYNYNAADKKDEQEDEVHDIWFDNYGCGATDQKAYEPNDYFKMLSHNYELPTGASWHKHDLTAYTSIYDGKAVGKVLKMQGKTGIAFKVEEPSTVTIVQAIARNVTTMPAADGTLLFYKKLDGETLKASATQGITSLEATGDLIAKNNSYIQNYFDQKEDDGKYDFYRLEVDNAIETSDYSATTTVYTNSFYEGQENTNTDTNENVRIYKIFITTPGTYILRNGGQYKPGVQLKKQYTEKDPKAAKTDESGLAYIKVQKGDYRFDVDWDKWQKNEYPDDKDSEDKTESSDPAGN